MSAASASCLYDGLGSPPPLRRRRASAAEHRSSRPTSISTSCRGALRELRLWSASPPRDRRVPPRATISATPARPLADEVRALVQRPHRPPPRRPDPPADEPPLLRALLQPGELLLLLRRGRASACSDRRRGHEHALGRAPRLRARARARAARRRRHARAASPRSSTSRRSWAWTTTTLAHAPSPASS